MTLYPSLLLFSSWNMCADMIGTFTETENPAKFKMKYWGVASYLQKGSEYTRKKACYSEPLLPWTAQSAKFNTSGKCQVGVGGSYDLVSFTL